MIVQSIYLLQIYNRLIMRLILYNIKNLENLINNEVLWNLKVLHFLLDILENHHII